MTKVKAKMGGKVKFFLKEFFLAMGYVCYSAVSAPSQEGKQGLTSHQKAALEMAIAQNVFKDSGYWDYALLMFYDEMVHAYILSGVTSLTNFGWAERTAFLAAGALEVEGAQTIITSAKSVSHVFIAYGRNLALFTVAAALFVIPDPQGSLDAALAVFGGPLV